MRDEAFLQKLFSISFLLGYMILTGVLVYFLFFDITPEDMPQWGISLISAIWGGMSGKLNTITDFLFGSSSENQKNQEKLRENELRQPKS